MQVVLLKLKISCSGSETQTEITRDLVSPRKECRYIQLNERWMHAKTANPTKDWLEGQLGP